MSPREARREGGCEPRRVHLASWPHWYAPNPYLKLLYDALEGKGVRHHPYVPLDPSEIFGHRPGIDVLHLHWLYPYWSEGAPGHLRRFFRMMRFRQVIRRIRRGGIQIVWTVHNLEPHGGAGPLVRRTYRDVHRTADLRVYHSKWSRKTARQRYGEGGPSVVVPHGSYDGVYRPTEPPEDTRAELGVDSGRTLLLCFGQLRPYKGFDLAVKSLNHLERGAYHLVLAGRPIQAYGERLRSMSQDHPQVTLNAETLSERFLGNLLGAADAVLLPYRDVTSSGALLTALTSGCGVVATDHPYFREVVEPEPAAAVFVERGDPRALAEGIRTFMDVPRLERSKAAKRLARRYRWDVVTEPLARWLRREAVREDRR